MMITNSVSLTSQQTLNGLDAIKTHGNNLDKSLKRLETGKKNIPAYENPVDGAKIGSLKSDLKAQVTLIQELNDKYTMLNVAENGVSQQQSALNNVMSKIKQSQDSDLEKVKKDELYKESIELIADINRVANNTTYKGLSLLNGNLENAKINTGIQTHQDIGLNITSKDINKITKIRFETGDSIIKSDEVSLQFEVSKGEVVTLDPVIISHSVGTGIGELAAVINHNSDTLGFSASYDVSTVGIAKIQNGFVRGIVINDTEIGSVEIKSSKDYEKLTKLINEKSEQTGVVASVKAGVLKLNSPSGRGINIRASSGLNLLKLPQELDENYGRLTLIQDKGIASNIVNSKPIGFNKLSSKTFGLNYFSKGNFSLDEKKAIGFQDDDAKNVGKFDLSNASFAQNFLKVIEATQKNLTATKQNIQFVRDQILQYRNAATSKKSDLDISVANLEDVDYAKEMANKAKFEQLQKGALYTFNQSLDHKNKMYEILFESFKAK